MGLGLKGGGLRTVPGVRAGLDKWRGDQKDIELKQSHKRPKRIPKGYNADKILPLKKYYRFSCVLLALN